MSDLAPQNTKVLVTGASGFFGRNVIPELLEAGYEVTAWVHETPLEIEGVTSTTVDIRKEDEVAKAVEEAKPDVIIHLAAYGVQSRQQDEDMAERVNMEGTQFLLKAAGKAKVIMAGTWIEYAPSDEPMDEAAAIEPYGLYGTTKAEATAIALHWAKEQGIELVLLRIFSAYGPGEDAQKLVPHICLSGLKGESAPLSSGTQIRDYVFVQDVAQAFVKAINYAGPFPKVFNIGSGSGISVKDLANKIYANFPDLEPSFGAVPDRPDRHAKVVANIAEAQSELDWMPTTSLEDGLSQTLAWYKANQEVAV